MKRKSIQNSTPATSSKAAPNTNGKRHTPAPREGQWIDENRHPDAYSEASVASWPQPAKSTPETAQATPPSAPAAATSLRTPVQDPKRFEVSSNEWRMIQAYRRRVATALPADPPDLAFQGSIQVTQSEAKKIKDERALWKLVNEGSVQCQAVFVGFEGLSLRIEGLAHLAEAIIGNYESWDEARLKDQFEAALMAVGGLGLALKQLAAEAQRPELWVKELEERVQAVIGKPVNRLKV